ncbi:MAG TPA: DUF4388 domain-containing protein [Vicinamibacteria bacterium]|nr:DUF4388 domain-containing protein [Vicinamibacteria bacterium]
MALEGTIKDFGLPDIFQLIGLQRKTGILTLTSETESITVTFENGMVVMADSSSKRLEDRIGNVLVKQGKLGQDRLEEALDVQRQTLQRLGHILTTNSFITSKDLKEALQTQVSQIVFRVFRWRDGHYNFNATVSVDFDRENFNPMSADFILMEGIRMVDEWPIIEKKIPSMDIVFRTVVDPSMIEVGGGQAEGDSKRAAASASNKIRLSAEEERIYRKVDGIRTVQAVIDSTGLGEFDVCRTLYDLLNRNIVAPAGKGTTAKVVEEEPTEGIASATPGYVVMALVILLAAAGILAQWRTPFAVTGLAPVLQETALRLRESISLSRLRRLDRGIAAYALLQGAPPKRLDDLVDAALVDQSALHDPWRRPYHYEPGPNGYTLSAVDDNGRTVPGTLIQRSLGSEKP